jgi:hypothetical protein
MASKSIVAGIVDRHGNFNRMVITHPGSLRFHINKGEKAYKLPNTKVQEPVENEQAYGLIQRLEEYIKARQARLIL